MTALNITLEKRKDRDVKVLTGGDVYGARYSYLDTEKQRDFIVGLIEGELSQLGRQDLKGPF